MAPETQEYDFGGDPDQRTSRLVYYATRHGMILTQHSNMIADAVIRIQALERDNQERDKEDVRADERNKAVMDRMTAVEASMNGLKSALNKAIAVIASAMALAIVNWMLSGGLRSVGVAMKAAGVGP